MNLGPARQSQIDTNEKHHSQIGKGDEEGRFGKVVAGPNSQKLTERGIRGLQEIGSLSTMAMRNKKKQEVILCTD